MSGRKRASLSDRLWRAGIRPFDALIHEQSRDWLIANFSYGATKYAVNVTRLMRNLIWQMRTRVRRGERAPYRELVRTYWYAYVKPVLSRADSLADGVDQYKQLVEQLVYLVKDIGVMRYAEVGFRDDNALHRHVGENAHIILFAEKLGQHSFLMEVAARYRISVIALGGQPSVLNVEYFVEQLRATDVNTRRSFHLFSIVDYDPSGWIARDSFVANLHHYGIRNVRVRDLIHPDMLTSEEVLHSRYPIPTSTVMEEKNARWLEAIGKRKYRNARYLRERPYEDEPGVFYGLESEAVTTKRIGARIELLLGRLLARSEALVRAYELEYLGEALKAWLLYEMFGSVPESGYRRRM